MVCRVPGDATIGWLKLVRRSRRKPLAKSSKT